MHNNSEKIRSELEKLYDMPFFVKINQQHGEASYVVAPQNELKELFEVTISFRQRVRMVIEIKPQRYSANMLQEMCNASKEKQQTFKSYVRVMEEKGAKVNISVNDITRTIENLIWGEKWNSFNIRVTRILDEHELVNEMLVSETIINWACLASGLMLSLLEIIEDRGQNVIHMEGKKSQVLSNRYERNPANRELCLQTHGYKCRICGFDFGNMYGAIGQKFIHVHHIEKVSSHGGEYILDPINDLIPVCPNCHAMLHKEDPPLSPGDLREIIIKQRGMILNG